LRQENLKMMFTAVELDKTDDPTIIKLCRAGRGKLAHISFGWIGEAASS
jgi:hypothetical protein